MGALSKPSDRLAETQIDDEIVVMRLDSGEFFSMTGTAAAIWRLIDGNRDRTAILASLAAEFGVDEGEIVTDVGDFLDQLMALGMIGED